MRNISQECVIQLMGSARGDLQFDTNGDLCYGSGWTKDNKEFRGATGPKLATISHTNGVYAWTLTPYGAQWVLENAQGCLPRRLEWFCEHLTKTNV